jgi:hypothetical protein
MPARYFASSDVHVRRAQGRTGHQIGLRWIQEWAKRRAVGAVVCAPHGGDNVLDLAAGILVCRQRLWGLFLKFPAALTPSSVLWSRPVTVVPRGSRSKGVSADGSMAEECQGLKPSPYASVQGVLRAKQMMVGDRRNETNPFQWERVEMNLPGSEEYDPTFPWIANIRKGGRVAADLHQYVDDLRLTAPDKELAWEASSGVAKSAAGWDYRTQLGRGRNRAKLQELGLGRWSLRKME